MHIKKSAYLFAYFIGNRPEEEQLFYAISEDGYNFRKLSDEPVLKSYLGKKSMRDPFILRGEDGKFYVIATDMKCSEGWASQSSIVVYKSDDLINFYEGTIIEYKNYNGFRDCERAWAPQAIWCEEKNMYMVYLALQNKSTANTTGILMYRQYTPDLMNPSLYTEPELMVDPDEVKHCAIDGDIIYDPFGERYIMYYSGKQITSAKKLTDIFHHTGDIVPFLTYDGVPMDVEGSNIYQIIGENKWIIAADGTPFNGRRYAMAETTDFKSYRELSQGEFPFDFTPRHGYVIHISDEEKERLEKAFSKGR